MMDQKTYKIFSFYVSYPQTKKSFPKISNFLVKKLINFEAIYLLSFSLNTANLFQDISSCELKNTNYLYKNYFQEIKKYHRNNDQKYLIKKLLNITLTFHQKKICYFFSKDKTKLRHQKYTKKYPTLVIFKFLFL